MNLLNLTGWRLDEAQAALKADAETRSLPLGLRETAAPPKKIDSEKERFGEWRILRAQLVEGTIELTVAREQIVD